MPSFDYFATFDESISMLRELTAQGFQVIVEPHLSDEPKAPTFDQVTDELVEILRVGPAFYLAGLFTRSPVQFDQLKEGPAAGKYAVDLLTQGPIMQGRIGRTNLVDGVNTLLPGRISYQHAYRNPETGEWEKPSAEVKAAFQQAALIIKKLCVRHQCSPGIDIFIGPEALALLKSAKVRIIDNQIVPAGRV